MNRTSVGNQFAKACKLQLLANRHIPIKILVIVTDLPTLFYSTTKIIMQITIELPDDIANQLQPVNASRRVLELITADHYRQGRIGAAEVRRMLDFASRWETYEFLKHEKAYLPYTEDDLEQDGKTIRSLLATE